MSASADWRAVWELVAVAGRLIATAGHAGMAVGGLVAGWCGPPVLSNPRAVTLVYSLVFFLFYFVLFLHFPVTSADELRYCYCRPVFTESASPAPD